MANKNQNKEFVVHTEVKEKYSNFEEVFKMFYPSMCMVALKYVEDEGVAKDIAQGVFVKLWEKRTEYQEVSSIKAFLYTMVRNASLNYLRDRKIRSIHHQQIEKESELFARNVEIEEESYRLLNAAIQQLPPRSAEIIKLNLKGLKNTEIAKELDISVNTVKTLKYNALKELRKLLKDYNYAYILLLMKLFS
ncbi:RNA polymerase sigma-70 factor [Rapidithrix thailandica]|uniref:RNA polymerase sigma-70 factor n=1 Tax=Rapidithrix thailandica TaxID=413964 RepID=A0AAW9SCK8_9BACT